MDPNDLGLFTTQELIAELMRRRTFMGVVVHSSEEARGQDWEPERTFKVHFNHNLDTLCASRLLDAVAEHMSIYPC
ncbi:MAG: hypothetical protein ACTHOU_19500 [Aureliella sp.]|jgi:hypothetical protein